MISAITTIAMMMVTTRAHRPLQYGLRLRRRREAEQAASREGRERYVDVVGGNSGGGQDGAVIE